MLSAWRISWHWSWPSQSQNISTCLYRWHIWRYKVYWTLPASGIVSCKMWSIIWQNWGVEKIISEKRYVINKVFSATQILPHKWLFFAFHSLNKFLCEKKFHYHIFISSFVSNKQILVNVSNRQLLINVANRQLLNNVN